MQVLYTYQLGNQPSAEPPQEKIMQVIKNPSLSTSKNDKYFIEAPAGSIEIGARVVREVEERTEVRKANRLSKGGTYHYPAHTVIVGFVSGAGNAFINADGERVQRYYIDNAVIRIM